MFLHCIERFSIKKKKEKSTHTHENKAVIFFVALVKAKLEAVFFFVLKY